MLRTYFCREKSLEGGLIKILAQGPRKFHKSLEIIRPTPLKGLTHKIEVKIQKKKDKDNPNRGT